MAILQPADGSESVRVKLGEVPESHPAWRLTALDARSAVFEGPEGRREMTLRVFDGQGGEPPTALNAAAAGATGRRPACRNRSARAAARRDRRPARPPAPPAPARATSRPPNRPGAAPRRRTVRQPDNDDAPVTPEAQMEAIRKRIEARRAQLRQQQAAQPPAQTP